MAKYLKKELLITKLFFFFTIFIKYKLHVRGNRRSPTDHVNAVDIMSFFEFLDVGRKLTVYNQPIDYTTAISNDTRQKGFVIGFSIGCEGKVDVPHVIS